MIRLVEEDKDKQRLMQVCEKTGFGCKIAATARSYGFDKGFACFWLDTEDDVAYCMADGVMVLSGTVMRPKETSQFFRAVGPQAVMCAVRNAEALGLPQTDLGDVLKKKLPAGEEKPYLPQEVNIRELYGLLEENEMVGEFEAFYLDVSHRLRHHTAEAFLTRRGDELAGCALVSSISETSGLLSALAVREPFRRQGIGSELVRRVEERFPGKDMYVFRDKEKNREFYKKMGYAKVDTWVYSQW